MYHSESIILSRQELREADLLVTFFSRRDGKLKGVARNAKKSRKRFGGVLETGYILDLHYSPGNKHDLTHIDQAVLVAPVKAVKLELATTYAIWLAIEMAFRFLPEAEANGEKYELLKRFIITIYERRLTRPILIYFLLRWISLCGFEPQMDKCVKCGNSCGGSDVFCAVLGGLLCGECSSTAATYFVFKAGTRGIITEIASGNVKCDVGDDVFDDLLRFVFHYCSILLCKPLRLENGLHLLMGI